MHSQRTSNPFSLRSGKKTCPPSIRSFYWSQVLQLQFIVFQLVRAFRNADFSLYLHSLSQLIPWMFSLDHINYARWLSVHLRDMRALQVKHPDVYRHFRQGQFVVHKTKHAFSAIVLDHAHEQINASLKEMGEQSALQRIQEHLEDGWLQDQRWQV